MLPKRTENLKGRGVIPEEQRGFRVRRLTKIYSELLVNEVSNTLSKPKKVLCVLFADLGDWIRGQER